MEGNLHRLLKKTVSNELQKHHLILYVEPLSYLFERLWWINYRPDLVGLLYTHSKIHVTIVECETIPKISRILEKTLKIQQTFTLQKRLHDTHLIRFLLVIPPNTFHNINTTMVRIFWDIWIINHYGDILHRIYHKK